MNRLVEFYTRITEVAYDDTDHYDIIKAYSIV